MKKVVKECLKNSSKEAKRTSKTANSNKNSSFSFDAFIFFIKNKTQIVVLNILRIRIFINLKMRKLTMFFTTDCVLFLIKLRWPTEQKFLYLSSAGLETENRGKQEI